MPDAQGHPSEALPKTPKRKRDPETGRYVTKLNPEMRERLLTALRHGMPLELAADYAGIVHSTMWAWLRSGRAAIASANGDLEQVLAKNEHAALAHEAAQAVAEWAFERVLLIEKAGTQDAPGDWQPNGWLLERRLPRHFQRRRTVEHTGSGGGPIQHAVTVAIPQGAWEQLPIEDRQALGIILGKIEGQVVEGEGEMLALGP